MALSKKTTPTKKKPHVKRTRKSTKLYAEVTLGKLKELFSDEDDTIIIVSRNFVIDEARKKLEDEAQMDLGI